jgi:hypothetical protein
MFVLEKLKPHKFKPLNGNQRCMYQGDGNWHYFSMAMSSGLGRYADVGVKRDSQ